VQAAGLSEKVASFWPKLFVGAMKGQDMNKLVCSLPQGGGGGGGGGAAAAPAAAAAAPKAEGKLMCRIRLHCINACLLFYMPPSLQSSTTHAILHSVDSRA